MLFLPIRVVKRPSANECRVDCKLITNRDHTASKSVIVNETHDDRSVYIRLVNILRSSLSKYALSATGSISYIRMAQVRFRMHLQGSSWDNSGVKRTSRYLSKEIP